MWTGYMKYLLLDLHQSLGHAVLDGFFFSCETLVVLLRGWGWGGERMGQIGSLQINLPHPLPSPYHKTGSWNADLTLHTIICEAKP